jgi:transposase
MPRSEPIVGLPGFETIEVEGTVEVITTGKLAQPPACPSCKSEGPHRRKDLCRRRIRHTSIGARAHWLVIHVPKWRCGCGRYFRQRIPGVLPYQRATEKFKEEVVERHEHGHSLSRIRDSHRISWATTERWVHQRYALRVAQQGERVAPKVLGIDEHFFTRKHGFATTFANLVTHRVFDVQLGRSEVALQRFLDELPGKEHTEVVLMDLSETYRAIVRRHFPNAMIVADRFHAIRLVGQCLMEAWKQLEPAGRKHRGLVSLLRRRPDRLKPDQLLRLRAYFAEHPSVGAVYDQLQRPPLREDRPRARERADACVPDPGQDLVVLARSDRPDVAVHQDQRHHRRSSQQDGGHQPPRLRLPELPELPLAGPGAVRLTIGSFTRRGLPPHFEKSQSRAVGSCPGPELNQRHADFQSAALPTELPGRVAAESTEEGPRTQASGSRTAIGGLGPPAPVPPPTRWHNGRWSDELRGRHRSS